MKSAKPRWLWAAVWAIALGLGVVLARPSGAAPADLVPPTHDFIYALTVSNHLLHFRSSAPGTILSDVALSGMQPSENMLAIDFRPRTAQLYGLGSSSRLYVINPSSGAATPVGSGPFMPALTGSEFGFDFNPVPDRIRVVGDNNQNLRLNPVTGAVAAVDTPLSFAPTDVYSMIVPLVGGSAYSNNVPTATLTTLYGYEFHKNALVTQGGVNGSPSANSGQLFTVGSSGVTACNTLIGLDIAASGQAYVSLNTGACTVTDLYTVNLGVGKVVLIGNIGGGAPIRDIAAEPPYGVYLPVIQR